MKATFAIAVGSLLLAGCTSINLSAPITESQVVITTGVNTQPVDLPPKEDKPEEPVAEPKE